MKLYRIDRDEETGDLVYTYPNRVAKRLCLLYWQLTWWMDWDLLSYCLSMPSDSEVSRWCAFWCRIGGHKCGTIYYNPGGYEPDYRCKNCSDDIG